jgi:hypothetical protein
MKSNLLSLTLFLTFIIATTNASAAFFSKVERYIITTNGQVISLSERDIDQSEQTGTYFDYTEGKKVTIKLSLLSKETDKEINGVKIGNFILVNFAGVNKPCLVYGLFENAMASIGCQLGKMQGNLGVDRQIIAEYFLNTVDQAAVTAEVVSLNGVNKKDHGTLLINGKALEAGTKIRVEVIFANGTALVQKLGLNFLDTSNILMKYNIEFVNLSDLKIE